MSLQKSVDAAMTAHRMDRFGPRIGVAVSGGADSVFLLGILVELGFAAAVLHVNHKLRQEESDADEDFVRQLAADAGLPFHTAAMAPGEGNLEQEARRLRYRFFREVISEGICDAVATGHTIDDQAETVIGRLVRGSGTAGLRGVLPVTAERIVRPVLGLRRHDIRKFLIETGIPWREDSSNQTSDFLRNRIRHDLMPRLENINPSVAETLASTALLAQDEEEYWDAEITRLAPRHYHLEKGAVLIRTGPFMAEPVAVQRRMLRRAFSLVRGDLRRIDFAHIEAARALMASADGSGRIQLPGLDVFRSFDWVRIDQPGWSSATDRNFEAEIAIPGTATLPERGLSLQIELVTETSVYNDCRNTLAGERLAGRLTLRNWQPGDCYAPQGASESVKIKTLFQDHRIPLWERRSWPVLVQNGIQGGRIIWSRLFGVDREFAAGPESTGFFLVRDLLPEVTESK